MKPRGPGLRALLAQYGVPFYLCLGTIVLVVLQFVAYSAPH